MATAAAVTSEHRVEVPGGRVHVEVHGEVGEGPALVGLHGGPGAGAAYLEPLAALADVMPVVLYDQLGCGRSDVPDDDSLWQVDRFVAELEAVLDAVGVERAVLYGHSWGGWLAIEHVLAHPARVVGMVLASASASTNAFVDGTRLLIDALPTEHRDALLTHEAAGAYEHPDYLAAMEVFYARHLCRSDPWPDELMTSVGNLETTPVYPSMNGPNEFTVVGTLQSWDRSRDLGRIDTPTLAYCGEHDEIVPTCTRELADGIAGARAEVVAGASHTALNEDPDAVLPMLRRFLLDDVGA